MVPTLTLKRFHEDWTSPGARCPSRAEQHVVRDPIPVTQEAGAVVKEEPVSGGDSTLPETNIFAPKNDGFQ